MAWTEERTEFARQKWSEGWSAGRIASELGGVTRNGVIGKVHRMGLSSANKPALAIERRTMVAGPVPDEIRVKRFKMPRRPVVEAAPIEGKISFFDEIKRCHCRWPFGNSSDINSFRFCGEERAGNNTPYCAPHALMAYAVRE